MCVIPRSFKHVLLHQIINRILNIIRILYREVKAGLENLRDDKSISEKARYIQADFANRRAPMRSDATIGVRFIYFTYSFLFFSSRPFFLIV